MESFKFISICNMVSAIAVKSDNIKLHIKVFINMEFFSRFLI